MDNEEIMSDTATAVCNYKSLYFSIKRVFDIFCSIIGIILLIPTTILVKLCYMLTGDFKSVIYTHERIGRNGKTFKLYKFRSMVWNADEVLEELLKDPKLEAEYKKKMKFDDDPRVTTVGKIIRKLSIDEMPQFINVLKNDMSLIGNRPYLPREKEDMGKYFDIIVASKPGLTGYWQTAGRNNVSFEKRLELEKYYSEHMNILLDIEIFFKTFCVVFFGSGAR